MRTLLLVAAFGLVTLTASAQQTTTTAMTPFAAYTNDAAHRAQGQRLDAELDHAGIRHSTTCSDTCTVSIESRRFGDAMYVLHMLVAREHLDIDDVAMATS